MVRSRALKRWRPPPSPTMRTQLATLAVVGLLLTSHAAAAAGPTRRSRRQLTAEGAASAPSPSSPSLPAFPPLPQFGPVEKAVVGPPPSPPPDAHGGPLVNASSGSTSSPSSSPPQSSPPPSVAEGPQEQQQQLHRQAASSPFNFSTASTPSPPAAAGPPLPAAANSSVPPAPVSDGGGGNASAGGGTRGGVLAAKPSPSPPPATPPPVVPSSGGNATANATRAANATASPSPSEATPAPSSGNIGVYNPNRTTCWVAKRDFPRRECIRWVDNCSVPSASETEACMMCSRGWGAYDSQEACLAAGGYKSSAAEAPGEASNPSNASAPSKPPTPAAAGPTSPAAANISASPAPAATVSDGGGGSGGGGGGVPSTKPLPSPPSPPPRPPPSSANTSNLTQATNATLSPSPSESAPAPGAPTQHQPLGPGPAPSSGDTGVFNPNRTSCWVSPRDFPRRECIRWVDNCRVPNASEVEACMMCSRGWGTYDSEEACLAAGGFTPSAAGIDPSTYPAPTAAPNSCNYDPTTRARSGSSPCPHLLPDVMLWESYSTWAASSGGQPTPGSGSAVVLPANTRVMITGCSFRGSGSNVFASIRIPASSELIFDDAQINLVVGAIYVYGRLRAGGEGCRVGAPISITFQPSAGVPESDLGIQVLQGGLLDLHGAAYYPTWTRLAATVQRGNNWLSLQDWVPWRPGQLLFVATSIYRDEYENQNEVAAVQSVSPDGRTIVVDRPFQYSHYGGPEYQTEVGLLSRSILLQSWPGSGATSRGAHVRIMGQGRLEGVLSYRMGQLNMLGAYPIHWHNAGDAGGGVSYAKDCAVYASYYRCFVVHGTNNLVLSDNVAFHATGSCFYLEDGVEEGNWLQHNLGAFVHVIGYPAGGVTQSGEVFVQGPGLAHPADAAAGVFYAANPNNAFKDNAASGGFAGFNFPVLPEPIGDHRWMRSTLNPSKRPLRLFDGNTAHSSGYFWLMAGSIYVGGKLWIDDADGGKLYYSNGRYEMDTRDDTGTALAFHSFTRNRVWLGQWGISHWGARVRVRDWEAHDCVRGANIFGLAQLADAVVNGRSGNVDAQYPAGDHDPIAGFRWYDTRVMTVLTNVTFQNYVYQPNLGVGRQSVWFSMVHSDEYKPAYISASRAITYRNIDGRALVNNPPVATGAGRYFNWIDTDGTATLRGRPTLVGSWPTWWNLGPDCTYQPLGNVYWCDYLPWRAVARLEVRVPGYTVPVDTGNAFSPDPAYYLGYVAQFGHRGSDTRNMTVTRNEGITGVSGSGGWYLHMDAGCTQNLQVFMTQIPPGNSLVFATRYPQGSTFSVSREFRWYTSLSSPVTQAGSLAEVLGGGGDLYWFSGKHLYIKMVDPGDGSVDPPFSVDGVTVWGTRYYSAWYWINVTSMGGQDPWTCPWVAGGTAAAPGARFCPMVADPATDIPDALPSYYNSWVDPFCTDVAPPGSGGGGGTNLLTCIQVVAQGLCSTDAVRRPTDPHVRVLGGYCAVSCGLCNQGDRACVDKVPPGGLTCTQRRATGNCASDWFKSGAWCAATCGFCTPVEPLPPLPPAPTCSDKAVPPGTYSCLQQLQWGQCTQPWMKANGWCLATCGLCAGQQQQQQQQPSTPAGCVDVTPPGGYTCAQQAAWGKCSADFMRSNNYCAATCNNCGTSGGGCGDIAPPGDYTCAQQASWGRCNEGFMLPYGYCAVTCRRCTGGGNCYDVQPSPEYSCAQQASWGKCGDPQLMPKGFCATTCGRCGSGTFAAAWDGEDDSGGGGSDRFISPYAAGVAAGGAASDRSDGAAVVNGSGNAAANAVTGVSSVKPTTADGGGGGGADQAVGPMAEDATAAPGGSAFLINPLGVASPFTVARPSGAAAASVLLYGTNSSYGPYQTAHHVASAASLSDPAYALDSAAASPAGTAADSVVASGGGGVGATKAGGAMTVTFISPGAGSAAAPAITAASEEDVSPTSDRAFNPFENTTSIPSPGSPLGAPKPGFYFAWLRAAVTAAAATDGAAFIAASEGGTDDSGSRGGSDVQMGGAVGYRSFLGLPVTTFGFINSTDLASSLLITNTSGAGASGFSAAESEKAQGTAMASLPVCPLCTDVPPAGGRLSCSELVTAGGCNADWAVAGHVCDGSCGRCTYVEPCIDVRPSGINESCQAARDAGHCSAGGLLAAAGWCRQTCGQCSGASGNSTAGAAIEERRRGDITNGVVLNSTGGSDGGDDCWVMSQCVDLPPPGSQGCDDAVRSGQCSSVWFSSQGYCVKSCGRCVA